MATKRENVNVDAILEVSTVASQAKRPKHSSNDGEEESTDVSILTVAQYQFH